MAKFSANNRLGGTQQAMTTTFKSLLTLSAVTATLRQWLAGQESYWRGN